MSTARKEYSSGGVVIKKRAKGISVLLIKDSYGRWTWPKGNIEPRESPLDAAAREIAEEVGLKEVELLEKIGETKYFYKLNGILRFKTVYLYLCEDRKADRIKIQLSEIRDAGWFTPEEALQKIDYEGSKELLQKAIKRFNNIKGLS